MDRVPAEPLARGRTEPHGRWALSWVGAILTGVFVGGPILGGAWMLLVVAPASWLADASGIPLAAVFVLYVACFVEVALLARRRGRAVRRMLAALAR